MSQANRLILAERRWRGSVILITNHGEWSEYAFRSGT
jgi:hypothetical protein